MKNTNFNFTKIILFSGFAVLIGSFMLFGQNLNEHLEVASLSSTNEDDSEGSKGKNVYHQCFEEICKKPVEDFTPKQPDYNGLIDEKLDAEIQKFAVEYSENEIEIQRLVKVRTGEILSGDLTGVVDFGLFNLGEISHDNMMISDLEDYTQKLYPDTPSFIIRLTKLSNKMIGIENLNSWMLGFDLKNQAWSAKMFLETGLYNEENFLNDISGLNYAKKIEALISIPTSRAKIKEVFSRFQQAQSFNLIYDEAWIYDAFAGLEAICRETIQDELYWASSDLRNRAVDKHFIKLKSTAKLMFNFENQAKKNKFDKKIDELELIKNRSIQEAKVFYPFYFKELLKKQKKSIELLERKKFKETVLYLNAYFESIPEFKRMGETPEERETEDYMFINKISLMNVACGSYDKMRSFKSSIFSFDDNSIYLEMKSFRSFGDDGVMPLAHEIGHGVSTLLLSGHLDEFEQSIKSDVWNKRSCVDNYYPESPTVHSSEKFYTEEDWADYFAVKLIAEYKKTGDYGWADNRANCGLVFPYDLDANEPLKPGYSYDGSPDTHSSALFRLVATELYSKGKLGPKCTNLAKKETKILDKCE